MRKPKDRDFIETVEGLFFCIVDYIHPPDKYTAYLKYIPSDRGLWSRGETKYERKLKYYHVEKVVETFKFLRQKYPQYIHFCPVRGMTFSMVPKEYVKKYYIPEERLKQMLIASSRDELEESLVEFVDLLSEVSKVGVEDFGVTGSILIEIHDPKFSDMDLTVYGLDNSIKVKNALIELMREDLVKRVPDSLVGKWIREISKSFELREEELASIVRKRWNYGIFKGRYFSIHPIRKDQEIKESYGDRRYSFVRECKIRAVVKDSRESIFMPAVYKVKQVEGEEEVEEVVSYEGLFRDVAKDGNLIEVFGKLEKVEEGGKESYRVVVGTTEVKRGYIRVVDDGR